MKCSYGHVAGSHETFPRWLAPHPVWGRMSFQGIMMVNGAHRCPIPGRPAADGFVADNARVRILPTDRTSARRRQFRSWAVSRPIWWGNSAGGAFLAPRCPPTTNCERQRCLPIRFAPVLRGAMGRKVRLSGAERFERIAQGNGSYPGHRHGATMDSTASRCPQERSHSRCSTFDTRNMEQHAKRGRSSRGID